MSKVEVNKGLCIGCGSCVSACPDCFEFDGDGKSAVKGDCKPDCCNLQEVADDCPVQAITVTD